MPHYLTNTQKAEGKANKVAQASKLSGQDVRLVDGPMPHSGTFDDDGYNREALLETHDCIVGYEADFDYSKFWVEYDKLA